jgi:two-component system LytT family response regulator
MLNAVIIDDEKTAILILCELLTNFSPVQIKIVGTALNLDDGIEIINKTQPDVVFLDIQMPGRNGFEIYNEFKSPAFKIIFCTAYEQYAIDAIKKYTSGYLIKPVDFFELQEALQKVTRELIQEQKILQLEDKFNILSTPEMAGENVMLKVENGFIMINTQNIEYCQTNPSNTVVVTAAKKEIVVTNTLKELLEIFPEDQFYLTHKTFLVNIYYLRKFVRAKESYVLMESGAKLPVSVRIALVIAKEIREKIDSTKK